MSRKLMATIAVAAVLSFSVLLHVFAFANPATPNVGNSAEIRLIIGTCQPTVYDPDAIQKELRDTLIFSEDVEELHKHWKAQSGNK